MALPRSTGSLSRSARLALCTVALALILCGGAQAAAPPPTPPAGPSVVIALAEAGEAQLQAMPGMSLAIVSAAQAGYSSGQLALDISQGARIAATAYRAPLPPVGLRAQRDSARIAGWARVLARAAHAPAILDPGLLAGQLPGGAGYAGVAGSSGASALMAADRHGRIAAASSASATTVAARTMALLRSKRFVVADLPPGAPGLSQLRALVRARRQGELLIAIARPPRASEGALLWMGAAGLAGGGGRELTSRSTTQRGLVLDIDITATVLEHLGLRAPAAVRGYPLRSDGPLHAGALRGLLARLRVISARRLRALAWLLIAWAALALACAPRASARAWALRAGGLGVLWAPVVSLLAAALEPSAAFEYALVCVLCLGLGALTDALLPWPRGPLAPALCALLAITVDALAGTQLLLRSLLGPDPALGARFYGVGNELKSGLAVLVLAAVAAALYPTVRARRPALAMALAGALLAVIEGSARIGAGVGGVILVCFAFALAAAALLPGEPTRRRALAIVLAPLAGLIALAAIDLATAHGTGHFTGSVLHARSFADIRDLVVRRYQAAWRELRSHAMPAATALAVGCAAWALLRARRLLAPTGGDPGWRAAVWGAIAAGAVGALVEDSGPLLLVVAVFTGGCVCSYLWGRPRPAAPAKPPAEALLTRPAERELALSPATLCAGGSRTARRRR